jgi:hypothetical protein
MSSTESSNQVVQRTPKAFGLARPVLVRSVARITKAGLAITAVLIMTSCMTTVDGIRISGHPTEASPQDVRHAINACSDSSKIRKVKPWQIEVVSRDEIHVYWLKPNPTVGGYDVAKRARGKWTCKESVITISPHER